MAASDSQTRQVITKDSPVSIGLFWVVLVTAIGAAAFCWNLGSGLTSALKRMDSIDSTLQEIKTDVKDGARDVRENTLLLAALQVRVNQLEAQVQELKKK